MESEIKKLPSKNSTDLYLGGIGQGAQVVLAAFLKYRRYNMRLGGVVALLSYNALEDGQVNRAKEAKKW